MVASVFVWPGVSFAPMRETPGGEREVFLIPTGGEGFMAGGLLRLGGVVPGKVLPLQFNDPFSHGLLRRPWGRARDSGVKE